MVTSYGETFSIYRSLVHCIVFMLLPLGVKTTYYAL